MPEMVYNEWLEDSSAPPPPAGPGLAEANL